MMTRLFLALALAVGLGAPAMSEPAITITGTGTVTAAPDTVFLTIAIETVADSAAEAQATNAEAAAQTILALREAGVRAQDLQTANFSIDPVFAARQPGSTDGPVITGYRVANRMVATVYTIATLGDLLDAVVASGANRIDGLQFAISNDAELMDEARRRAVAEATRRAQLYAEAMGVILGPIQSLHEGGGNRPGPTLMAEARMATPIMPGTLEVSAMVTMRWAIFDR